MLSGKGQNKNSMNENLNKNTKKGKLQLSILKDEYKLCIALRVLFAVEKKNNNDSPRNPLPQKFSRVYLYYLLVYMRYSHLQPNVYMETMLVKKSCHEVVLEAIMENNGCVQEANWYHASCCFCFHIGVRLFYGFIQYSWLLFDTPKPLYQKKNGVRSWALLSF